ncbi:MAG: ABC transporter permease [Rhodococcus sp. (in: high G+C Gram-positive bacteria)]|uniref:ABC transporter permease n=1 Tax=Rhodococcus sp. TaxID=1831 RepID=UPI002AD92C20|nr:ABC transporter permease [Rhodococcus sp. (in: high G+C Gram-positive bacteria)]
MEDGAGSVTVAITDGAVVGSTSAPEATLPKRAYVTSKKQRKSSSTLLGNFGIRLIVPILIFTTWWGLSQSEVGSLIVAPPLDTFHRVFTDFFGTDAGRFFLGDATFDHFFPSVYRALAGLLLAVVIGVAVGITLGVSPVLAAVCSPLIHLGRSLPSPALLGVFFFLFGTGDSPKIFLIAFSVVWPILFNTIDGVQSVGMARMQTAAVFKISRWNVLTYIILPGASPKIFAGVRTAMSLSLIIMIISELQKSENGLGYLLIQTQRNFDYTGFWSVLIVLAALGVALNFIFVFVERRALAWHRGVTQQDD